ncbi:MAG: hypothetical protein D6698_16095, partial [Gammaproteobacteria bacterium]
DNSFEPDYRVIEKIADSISGIDAIGNPVPYSGFLDTQKYGTDIHLPKTVFTDTKKALGEFERIVNEYFRSVDLPFYTKDVKSALDLASKGVWWDSANYVKDGFEDVDVFDTVASRDYMMQRAADGAYIKGDVIEVQQDDWYRDFWGTDLVTTRYQYKGQGAFEIVQLNNHSIQFDLSSLSGSTLREAILQVYDLMDADGKQQLLRGLFHEMLRQNPDADWIIKTSYITAKSVENPLDTAPYQRPDQASAVEQAILEYKPFRTKLRASNLRYRTNQHSDWFTLQVEDDKVINTKLVYDRLGCYASEDGGYDIFAYDGDPHGYDSPIWYLSEDGTTVMELRDVVEMDGVSTSYQLRNAGHVRYYPYEIKWFYDGKAFDPSVLGVTWTVSGISGSLSLKLSSPLPSNVKVEFWQSNTLFDNVEPSVKSFQHYAPRMFDQGIYAPFEAMPNCETEGPGERVELSKLTSASTILVKTNWSKYYDSFDSSPYDVSGYASAPTDVGQRVFSIVAREEVTIPAANYLIPTSETINIGGEYAAWTAEHGVAEIRDGSVPLQEGLDYDRINRQAIKLKRRSPLTYTGDGVTTNYDVSSCVFGIDSVEIDGTPQVPGVDYTVTGNMLSFAQPAPLTTAKTANFSVNSYVGDGTTNLFDTGQPTNSINKTNTLVFVNGKYVSPLFYSLVGSGIQFPTPPAPGDTITIG